MSNLDVLLGNISVDDRGEVLFVNSFDFPGIVRFHQITNHNKSSVRAWYGHEHGTVYAFVAKGTAMFGIMPIVGAEELTEENCKVYIISSKRPRILCIPAGYYYGFKALDDGCMVQMFSTQTLEESREDTLKKPWNFWNIWNVNNR